LLFELTQFGRFVWISGFETKPKDVDMILRAAQERYPNTSLQLVDLDKVAGSRFLLLATFNALRSFDSKQPISRTLGMEILLYISGNRQISEAVKLVGVASATNRIAAVVVGASKEEVLSLGELLSQLLTQENRDEIIDLWSDERLNNVRSVYDVGQKELQATLRKGEDQRRAVERLAIERSAMLAIKK
jgi:tRNA threonylcarbamoyladenosine modification (KEOPS) complex Cgi121 subunit